MIIIQIIDTKKKRKCNESLLFFIQGGLEVQGKTTTEHALSVCHLRNYE
jgi:hypothetical protein